MADQPPSGSRGGYNMRNPSVKRLMKEASELREPTAMFYAQPLEDNLFEWHFTIRGPPDSDFAGGLYHGRIILPPEYPMKPPSILMLTPNGRFQLGTKICLSISGFHPESWQPSWSIRTALLAMVGFLPTNGAGAIGSLDYSPAERAVLAKRSPEWFCQTCKVNLRDILPPLTDDSQEIQEEAKELGKQLVVAADQGLAKSASTPTANPEYMSTEQPQATSTPAASPDAAATAAHPHLSSIHQSPSDASLLTSPNATPRPVTSSVASWSSFRHPVPAPTAFELQAAQADRTLNTLMIFVVTLMLAALILRRFYLANEWRFTGPRSDEL